MTHTHIQVFYLHLLAAIILKLLYVFFSNGKHNNCYYMNM